MSEAVEAVTEGVRVRVEASYLEDKSKPAENQWLFAYQISILNEGTETAQLLSRHWIITDANGEIEEVRGPGVVGQQPMLEPGQVFTYTSFCPLGTSFGTMHGTYQMVAEGRQFDVDIPPFTLSPPYAIN